MDQPHFGVANVAISGDTEKGLAYVTQAQSLLRSTLEQLRVRGLKQLTQQQRFADDVYCYVVCAGGYNMVRIVADYSGSSATATQAVKYPVDVPDFVSGAVVNGAIVTVPATDTVPAHDTLSQFHPTTQCANFLGLPPGFQTIDRLTVKPFGDFDGDVGGSNFQGEFSQYRKLKPTLYSGRMKRLVQALMGFGRQRTRGAAQTSIYDTSKPITTSKTKPPSLTGYEREVAQSGLQIRYDWRFSRTHGITAAADGKLWLVEIGVTQGVIAYPLPLNEHTTGLAFRAKLDALADTDGLSLLDEFGGFPTGETFPPAEQIDAWVRAGKVLRLCTHEDMAVFYDYVSSYSSWMGWAFNLDGSEAHNTAYYYDDNDVMHGVHYMVPISIGQSEDVKVKPETNALRVAFNSIASSNKDIVDAAKYKLDRLDVYQLGIASDLLKATNNGPQIALNYVDSLELSPIASGSAHLSKVMDGYLFNPSKTGNLIKFPEPEINLLLSVDMRPGTIVGRANGATKRCDTTVHVFFADNELKWVKYYRDPDGTGKDGGHTDDYEECMYVGIWSAQDTSGRITVSNALYTNDVDDRAEYAGSQTDTIIKSIDLGYYKVSVSDDITNPGYGHLTRAKRFKRTTTIDTVTAECMATGVIVPFYDREAYLYAYFHTDQGRNHQVGYSYTTLTDPYSCRTWRNFPGYIGNWIDLGSGNYQLNRGAQHPDGCGPVTARTVWENPAAPNYDPYTCGDYADSGPWCFVCDNADNKLYEIPPPTLPAAVNQSTPGKSQYQVTLVTGTSFGPIKTYYNGNASSFGDWPLHSPLGDPNFSSDQYAEETHNVMGSADVMRYSSNVNGPFAILGGPAYGGIESGTLTFIGVIDG